MKKILSALTLTLILCSCKESKDAMSPNTDTVEIAESSNVESQKTARIEVMPISHATFVMKWDDQVIYFDPTGGADAFAGKPEANLILVTDIHGDHMSPETLMAVKSNSTIIAPKAVADQLDPKMNPMVMNNGDSKTIYGITITAIPMYNITEGRLDKHVKGRGNGYVLEKDGYRVYVSGDTEGIPEMRNLQNIDKAFVCMNLPYTMDVEQAADAVLEFAPKEVVPFHYRGNGGLADIEKFKSLVNEGNDAIEVTFLNWYPTATK